MSLKITSSPWYQNGLRFKCTECGACCTKAPGFVWLKKEDITRLAKHLKLSEDAFLQKYTRKAQGKITLLEDPKTYDCVFLAGKKCSVYPARPVQCKTYPFWPSILQNAQSWKEEKNYCEGISEKAPLLSLEEIEKKKKEALS